MLPRVCYVYRQYQDRELTAPDLLRMWRATEFRVQIKLDGGSGRGMCPSVGGEDGMLESSIIGRG